MSLFSIITVTLNPGTEDLLKTVQSVLAQNFDDWELLIKDGDSTDGSISSLPEDSRISLIQQEDSGIFDAMNQAIKLVTGKFICFLNAGDYFIDKQVLDAVADIHFQSPDAIFLYGNVHKPFSRSRYEIYPARLTGFYLFKHMICHQAWFVQKSYYSSVGGYETTYPSGGDYRFLLRMLLHDDVKYHRVPKVLLYYKGGGVSQQENILHKANQWVDELRQEIFTRYEYTFFSFIWKLRDVLKVILYDFLLYKGWRYVQKTRALF